MPSVYAVGQVLSFHFHDADTPILYYAYAEFEEARGSVEVQLLFIYFNLFSDLLIWCD
jgi:hypothetical protein